ncbi:hypothetical protein KP509_25G022900 [Ceratopteris richardii]|nr:hypothetical protein KP509_25G022900 [Ceratopteris richardii]
MLDCCEPLESVKKNGITFSKVACLAQCAGASVQAFRASESSLDMFRSFVEMCVASDDHHLIVSYDRRIFKQTGTGHFSPVGGYHRERDLALILDVARFKYPPHWIPLPLLWEAMNSIDEVTGKSRGFMMIFKRSKAPCYLFTLSCKDEHWRAICKYVLVEVPQLLRSQVFDNPEQVICTILGSLPAAIASFVKWVVEVRPAVDGPLQKIDKDENQRLLYKSEVLQQLRETKVSRLIANINASYCGRTSANENLEDMAWQACCQGAAAFTGINCLSNIKCIKKEANVATKGEMERAVVFSNRVLLNGCEQVVDALVPKLPSSTSTTDICECSSVEDSFYPSTRDLLAILLIALPASTWEELSNDYVHQEICQMISIEDLPTELQLEVEHVFEQLVLLKGSCAE